MPGGRAGITHRPSRSLAPVRAPCTSGPVTEAMAPASGSPTESETLNCRPPVDALGKCFNVTSDQNCEEDETGQRGRARSQGSNCHGASLLRECVASAMVPQRGAEGRGKQLRLPPFEGHMGPSCMGPRWWKVFNKSRDIAMVRPAFSPSYGLMRSPLLLQLRSPPNQVDSLARLPYLASVWCPGIRNPTSVGGPS